MDRASATDEAGVTATATFGGHSHHHHPRSASVSSASREASTSSNRQERSLSKATHSHHSRCNHLLSLDSDGQCSQDVRSTAAESSRCAAQPDLAESSKSEPQTAAEASAMTPPALVGPQHQDGFAASLGGSVPRDMDSGNALKCPAAVSQPLDPAASTAYLRPGGSQATPDSTCSVSNAGAESSNSSTADLRQIRRVSGSEAYGIPSCSDLSRNDTDEHRRAHTEVTARNFAPGSAVQSNVSSRTLSRDEQGTGEDDGLHKSPSNATSMSTLSSESLRRLSSSAASSRMSRTLSRPSVSVTTEFSGSRSKRSYEEIQQPVKSDRRGPKLNWTKVAIDRPSSGSTAKCTGARTTVKASRANDPVLSRSDVARHKKRRIDGQPTLGTAEGSTRLESIAGAQEGQSAASSHVNATASSSRARASLRVHASPALNLFAVAGAKGTALSQLRRPLPHPGPARSDAFLPETQLAPSPQKRPTQLLQATAAHQTGRRMPKLRRTQSLPNLRVVNVAELTQPMTHRLMLPPHLAEYLAVLHKESLTPNAAFAVSSAVSVHAMSLLSGRERERHQVTRTGAIKVIYTPPMSPPITRATLRELDLSEILKNPQLRHDIVFDANVQFRPNFDGERGRKKREACERYWEAVGREIETGCTCTTFEGMAALPCTCSASRTSTGGSQRPSTGGRPRIPLLVQELRAICLSVLPLSSMSTVTSAQGAGSGAAGATTSSTTKPATVAASALHHALLSSALDPALIAQQMAHGMLDVAGLVNLLASILKLHCAPMRDDMIETMVEGARRGQVGQGLRMCFEILELMKLDIANHQLRSARPYLVETAVEFEARWFRDQIEYGRTSLERTSAWFLKSWEEVIIEAPEMSRTAQVSEAFAKGFTSLILDANMSTAPGAAVKVPFPTPSVPLSSSSLNHSYAVAYPETFQFDAYRLTTFHNDAVDLVVVHMLLLLYSQLACSPAIARTSSSPRTTAGLPIASVVSRAAALAKKTTASVKAEIWCLLNEANVASGQSLSSGVATKASSTQLQVTGLAKLGDERWREAMQGVVLQIAARAGAVWDAADAGEDPASGVQVRPPTPKTLALLEAWVNNNLVADSPLMRLCLSRLRRVLASMVSQWTAAAAAVVVTATRNAGGADWGRKRPLDKPDGEEHTSSKKRCSAGEGADVRTAVDAHDEEDAGGEQLGEEIPSTMSSCASVVELGRREICPRGSPTRRRGGSSASLAKGAFSSPLQDLDEMIAEAGLDSLRSEIRVLGGRVTQVAAMNHKTFRHLYEKLVQTARMREAS